MARMLRRSLLQTLGSKAILHGHVLLRKAPSTIGSSVVPSISFEPLADRDNTDVLQFARL